jgi:hypothetical protein
MVLGHIIKIGTIKLRSGHIFYDIVHDIYDPIDPRNKHG